jgi:hypothetical protein
VLGKLGARLVHVGAFALANFPLLAFMNLWGNVDAAMLVYHEINLFLILVSAGSVCIWMSANSESTFQAISGSYAWLALLGALSMLAAFVLPWMFGTLLGILSRLLALALPWMGGPARAPDGQAHYWLPVVLLALGHGSLALFALHQSIGRMEVLRREERRKPRKTTGALTLTDKRSISTKTGKRGQVKSRIHPWAWPIGDRALFWKECVKDGTHYSLSVRWFYAGLAVIIVVAGIIQLLNAVLQLPEGASFGACFPFPCSLRRVSSPCPVTPSSFCSR